MTGLVVFGAGVTLSLLLALVAVVRTAASAGGAPALKEAAALGASLAAYVAVCVWLGYGFLPQFLGCLADGAVLWFGRRWVPALAQYAGRHDAEA